MLYQNYPNPFNPSTQISYEIAKASHVQLDVYNVIGQRVRTLINEKKTPGKYEITIDFSDLATGSYLCILKTNSGFAIRKMVMIK